MNPENPDAQFGRDRNDFDTDFASLLREGQAELDAPPRRRPEPLQEPGATSPNSTMGRRHEPRFPAGADQPHHGRSGRGQAWGWSSMILILLSSGLIGGGNFAALNAVAFSTDPLGAASGWVNLVVLGLVLALVGLLVAVVAMFRARPKLIATLALVLSLVAPLVAFVVGLKFGADALGAHGRDAVNDLTPDVARLLDTHLSGFGVDPDVVRRIVEWLLS